MPRRGRRRIVFRHALLEALDALGDVAHHIGKAPLAEQQQDDHAENEPVPDAQTTHRKSPCAAHIGAAVSNCTRASPKTASRPALCVFAILYQDRKSVVEGRSVSVRVDPGGGLTLKKKKQRKTIH